MKYPIIYIVITLAIIQEIQSIFFEIYAGMLLWDRFFGTFECPKKKEQRLKAQEKVRQEEAERQRQQQILWQQQQVQQQQAQQQQIQQQQEAEAIQFQQQESERIRLQQEAERIRLQQEAERIRLQQESERLRLQQEQINVMRQKQWTESNRVEIISNPKFEENRERWLKIMKFQQQQKLYQFEEQRKLNESLGIRCVTRVRQPDRYEENAWHEYLYNWQYDYCMIASI